MDFDHIHFILSRHFDTQTPCNIDYRDIFKQEQRSLVIVFWSLSGFTKICDVITDELDILTEFLQDYFYIISEKVFKYYGCIDKILGDGVMAIFGFNDDKKHKDLQIRSAVLAALEIRDEFMMLNEEWTPKLTKALDTYYERTINLSLKCGMEYGKVFSGLIGTKDDKISQLTAMGSVVNYAAKLNRISKPNNILISNKIFHTIQNEFQCNQILIKSKKNSVSIDNQIVYNIVRKKYPIIDINKFLVFGSLTPNHIRNRGDLLLSAIIRGPIQNGSLLIEIVDNCGIKEIISFRENNTFNGDSNIETITLKDGEEKNIEWKFKLYRYWKAGRYKAIIRLYINFIDVKGKITGRKLLSEEVTELEILE